MIPIPFPTVRRMIREARASARRAYAPYSRFRVGASVLTKSGKVYSGCNVENSSYGLTVCAERVAIFKAVQDGHKEISAVVIVTRDPVQKSPCGACLQVLAEFALPETQIFLDGRSLKNLSGIPWNHFLPKPFRFPLKNRA